MDKYKYFCEKCVYGTDVKNSFEKHERSTLHITGVRKKKPKNQPDGYKCEQCDYHSVCKNNYLTHRLNKHDDKESRKSLFKYYCEKCDVGVFTESMFNGHLKTKRHNRN